MAIYFPWPILAKLMREVFCLHLESKSSFGSSSASGSAFPEEFLEKADLWSLEELGFRPPRLALF